MSKPRDEVGTENPIASAGKFPHRQTADHTELLLLFSNLNVLDKVTLLRIAKSVGERRSWLSQRVVQFFFETDESQWGM